ncbi:Ku protein [Myxococcus stipitatus DSM 14675]|uniref:Non-homologous end joining protein Ku n=1 Tax=Myxococcus stipitatus (strain DSM 14675 / JCM 12634 / Mx s8) TaxID=1278073 RepID=L7UMY1_MYXSD|nr:Ku protein [Myxococcus stipitatus]AGC47824.1 Ku protein [Myxococcus stipitatus DSM 14675]
MSRPVWVGSLSFGPLTLPVRLHGAVASHQARFHLLHDADGARIQNKRVCSVDGEEVPLDHVVRGYTLPDGRHVTVTRGELDALDPTASRVLALEDFVDPAQVDSLLFDTSYHLVPAQGAEHAYALLTAALQDSGRAGVGRLVLYQKGHLCLVRPHGRGLVLTTLHAMEDRVAPEALAEQATAGTPLDSGELEALRSLIASRSVDFDPRRHPDVHRERVMAFLERRAHSGPRSRRPPRMRVVAAEALLGVLEKGLEALRSGPATPPSEGTLRVRPSLAARDTREKSPPTPPSRERSDDDGGEPSSS